MVREIATTGDGYPVVAVAGMTCLARLRGRDRVVAAYDLSSGDVLWTFDIGVKNLARLARGAGKDDGSFLLPRAKRKKLEICRVSPGGKVEVVDEVIYYQPGMEWDALARNLDAANVTAQVHVSQAGEHAVRMDNATWSAGRRISGEPLGWAGETLVVVAPSRFDATSVNGYREGESVWWAGIQAYERPLLTGDQVLFVRPLTGSRVRAISATTGAASDWTWEPATPIVRWVATPFAALFLLEKPATPTTRPVGGHLATLLPTGTLASAPMPLGNGVLEVDLVAADPARVLWMSAADRRLVCAPLAEPGATVWEATLPADLTLHDAYSMGSEPRSSRAVIASDAGVLIVGEKRIVLLA